MPRTTVSSLGHLLLTGFSTRWSVGSVLFLVSWAVLMGPWTYAKHLISGTRLPFTAAYFGSIALTLYFAIGVSKIDFFFFRFRFRFWISCLVFTLHLVARRRSLPLMILPSTFPCLSHTRSPSLYPSPYGRTAQPGKGESCSLYINRAVQHEIMACAPSNPSHPALSRSLCSESCVCTTSHHGAGLGYPFPYYTLSDTSRCHRARSPEPSRSIYVSPFLTTRSSCSTCISQLHTIHLLHMATHPILETLAD